MELVSVNVLAMTNAVDFDYPAVAIDLVGDSVIAHPDSIRKFSAN
jgi:hypothetical protein